MDSGGEDRLIRRLRRRLEAGDNRLVGDDAAFLPAAGDWAVSVDQQIESVHFPPRLDPSIIGRRAVAVALSDLAAVGAEPRYALLALACPRGFEVQRLLDAALGACQRFRVELAGGDVARSPYPAATVTVVGRRPPRGSWLRRGLARPGDRLWVGGRLGLSGLGRLLIERGATIVGRGVRLPHRLALPPRLEALARRAVRCHLTPTPQIELGLRLALRKRVAAIDVSDGLALDLHRLCRESGTGSELDTQSLPISSAEQRLAARLGADYMELVLSGGEDYALLFAMAPSSRPPASFACRPIGRIRAGGRIQIVDPGGQRPLAPTGWDHLLRT